VSLPAVEKGWNFQEVYTSRKKPLTRDVRKLVVWNPLGLQGWFYNRYLEIAFAEKH
jgi:hypothetical protein